MRRLRFPTICATMALSVVAISTMSRGQDVAAIADDQPDGVRSIDEVKCVFAARTARFRFGWGGKSKLVTHVEYEVTVGDRIISHGNIRPEFIADDKAGDHVAFSLKMPPVNPGVVLTAEFNVMLHAAKNDTAALKQPLFIFADDPFVDRQQRLQELKIRLFDPEGTTVGVFEKDRIPFELLTTAATIGAVRDGVLVVAEEISWSDHSAAITAAQRAARRGCRVLCLAPKEGDIPLYAASSDELAAISSLQARRESVLQQFDKRFDQREWLGGPSVVSRFALVAEKNVMLARVTDSSTGWPWLEIHVDNSSPLDEGGLLIVCGFGIIKYWNDGPVPRYLFSALLDPLQTTTNN